MKTPWPKSMMRTVNDRHQGAVSIRCKVMGLLHHMEGVIRTSILPTTNTINNNRDNRPGPKWTMTTTTKCGNLIILSGFKQVFYVYRGLYVSFVLFFI